MLRQFTRKSKSYCRLDLPGRKGGLLSVSGKFAGLCCQTVENVSDEGIENRNATFGDTSVRMYLLQHLVDVGSIAFDTGLFLRAFASLLRGFRRLL